MASPSADRRGHHADQQRQCDALRGPACGSSWTAARSDDRHAHEKAEHGRALTVQPQRSARGDCRAGAGHAGTMANACATTDGDGIAPRSCDAIVRFVGGPSIGEPQDDAHGDECRCDQRRRAERFVGFALEARAPPVHPEWWPPPASQTPTGRGHHPAALPQHREHPARPRRAHSARKYQSTATSVPSAARRRTRAGILPAQKPGRERQVRRTADRQELGEPLQQSEDERLEWSHCPTK